MVRIPEELAQIELLRNRERKLQRIHIRHVAREPADIYQENLGERFFNGVPDLGLFQLALGVFIHAIPVSVSAVN